jgi:hypothetical protein
MRSMPGMELFVGVESSAMDLEFECRLGYSKSHGWSCTLGMDSYAEASCVAVAGDMSLSVSVPDSDSDSE